MTVWHVCGTSGRRQAATHRDGSVFDALTWAFICAPSVIRTRDLLLRRQSLYPLSYRGPRETLAYLRRAHGSRIGGAGE